MITSNRSHDEILADYWAQCPGGWHTGPNDGYFFEHLAYHLHEAGRRVELYTLLTASPDWMEAKFAACAGDTSYAADLDLAISDFADPLDADQVLILAQLHAARQVVHRREYQYDNTDLKTLVWLGREQEALNHAQSCRTPREQLFCLMEIREAQEYQGRLEVEFLLSLVPIAYRIEDRDQQGHALYRLATILAQAGYYEQAGEIARSIRSDWSRAKALISLAVSLTQAGNEQAPTVLHEASEAARRVEHKLGQADTQSHLAAALAQAGRFDEADRMARGVQFDHIRAEALVAIAAAMAKAGSVQATQAFREAGELVQHLGENESDRRRENSQRTLVKALIQVGYFTEAGQTARKIWRAQGRANALIDLATALAQAGDTQAAAVFDEVREVTRSISFDDAQADTLSSLAAALAQAGNEQAIDVFEEAGKLARNIEHEETRVRTLGILAAALAQAGSTQAAAVFREAKALARTTPVRWKQDGAQCALAAVLIQAGRYAEAEKVAHNIESAWSRSDTLSTLAVALAQAGNARMADVFREAWEVARHISHPEERPAARRRLASALAQVERFVDALGVARSIEDKWYQAEALRIVAMAFARAGRYDDMSKVVYSIQHEAGRAEALIDLAETLTQAKKAKAKAVFREAGKAVRDIQDDAPRATALRKLAEALAKTGNDQAPSVFREAEEVAHRIQDERLKAYMLSDLATALAQAKYYAEAGRVARSVVPEDIRVVALSALAAASAESGDIQAAALFLEARQTVQLIQDGGLRSFALRTLVEALIWAKCYAEAEEVAQTPDDLVAIHIQTNHIASAFLALGKRDPDEMISAVVELNEALEALRPGFSAFVLQEVVRIMGWERSDWHKVYEMLTTGEKSA